MSNQLHYSGDVTDGLHAGMRLGYDETGHHYRVDSFHYNQGSDRTTVALSLAEPQDYRRWTES